MKPARILTCMAALVAASTAQALVVTPLLSGYAPGANVSAAFPGVTLTRLAQPPGGAVYAPVANPAIIGTCSTYGACPYFGPVNSIGGNLHSVAEFRNCYNANLLGLTHADCAVPFSVLEARFTQLTDFVEFELTWWSDPPLLLAYDSTGAEILSCGGFSPCVIDVQYTPGFEYSGTVRVAAGNRKIAKVVVGSFSASSRLYGLQYNYFKTPPTCP